MEYGPLLFYVNSSRRCRVEIGRVALPLLLLYSMPSAKFLDPQIYAFARGQLTQFLAGSKKPHAYYYIFLSNSLFMTVMMCVHFSILPDLLLYVECLFLYLLFLLVTFAFHHVMWEYELYEGGYKKQGQP